MALLTYLNLLWLVHIIPPALQVVAPEHPLLAVSISVALIVGLMSYLILPLVRRFLGGWLYR
jgi:antibiotic biosynthesis monooxygenase (ABM) superfamily enzyme